MWRKALTAYFIRKCSVFFLFSLDFCILLFCNLFLRMVASFIDTRAWKKSRKCFSKHFQQTLMLQQKKKINHKQMNYELLCGIRNQRRYCNPLANPLSFLFRNLCFFHFDTFCFSSQTVWSFFSPISLLQLNRNVKKKQTITCC